MKEEAVKKLLKQTKEKEETLYGLLNQAIEFYPEGSGGWTLYILF